jgi:hypothetical protein
MKNAIFLNLMLYSLEDFTHVLPPRRNTPQVAFFNDKIILKVIGKKDREEASVMSYINCFPTRSNYV